VSRSRHYREPDTGDREAECQIRYHLSQITLADAHGGTEIRALHDGLPRGLSTADNEAGWREALAKLATLVEAG
jgi:hypothetical protein